MQLCEVFESFDALLPGMRHDLESRNDSFRDVYAIRSELLFHAISGSAAEFSVMTHRGVPHGILHSKAGDSTLR